MHHTPIAISGSRHDIGVELGKLARPIMASYLDQSSTWAALRPWRDHPYLDILGATTRARLPSIWKELEGLAEGLRLPLKDVLLWHSRGDLLHHSGDGCTSFAWRSPDNTRWIAHNEDGDPYLRGRCHVVNIQPDDAPGYLGFYCPGSLPGHAFAVNRCGLVQTINDLHSRQRHAGVPRVLLARAILDCTTLDSAIKLLADTPHAGGFHHLLGSTHDTRLLSVEIAPSLCSVQEISRGYAHANHLIHAATQGQAQIITHASETRQTRADRLLDTWAGTASGEDLVCALLDTNGALPILRCAADDPEGENTLTCALFEIGSSAVTLSLYDRTPQIKQRWTTYAS